ncbi:MAG: peptide chain release factor 1 [Candidatus Poribacteria bacterium]|nr:peptide chain release factor 1 [Candidatus Poribacteria bacterium]
MLQKLDDIEAKFREVEQAMSDPKVYEDQREAQRLGRLRVELAPVVDVCTEYRKIVADLASAREVLGAESDPELIELAEEEIAELEPQLEALEERLKVLLLPVDPNDEKDTVVEIRSGTGGEEAKLFAGELFRMYSRYAERLGWSVELITSQPTELGGFKEVTFTVSGDRVYSRMKFESGVHRVQRVPETETSGRIHTSAATVAVLPEAEEVDVEIDTNDLRVDTFRSGGPGGQHLNTTDSAVRITHVPTGIVVACQDERSQIKNRLKAMRVLRARLYEVKMQEQESERASNRKSMVGSGDRSEKIRTYNFHDHRVTDHRIGLTIHQIDAILDGDLDTMVDALIAADQAERLKEL